MTCDGFFQPMPLYHPSMTFGQVVPTLSREGRDLLQVHHSILFCVYEVKLCVQFLVSKKIESGTDWWHT